MDYSKISVEKHREKMGKWAIISKFPLENKEDLSIAYSPGVAGVSEAIANNIDEAYELTMKGNSVAIISDGSAVLGLGDIGPEAGLPVMEGKAILFKEFAGIDAVPLVINATEIDDIVNFVKTVSPTFGGINLEDIKAPKCFEIEAKLQDIGIPVFHDDQHGTAIVLLAALINASKLIGKKIEDMKVVVNGAGAAGIAITNLLKCVGFDNKSCTPVKEIVVCDSKGIISSERNDLNDFKKGILKFTNKNNLSGSVKDAIVDADCFIGVSKGNLLTREDIKTMAPDSIIFGMANPIPEIFPDEAKAGGARIVGTGRSDLPNQVNNVLAFPGIFKGALLAKAKQISPKMKMAAALALANSVENPTEDMLLPNPLDKKIPYIVAEAVKNAALEENV